MSNNENVNAILVLKGMLSEMSEDNKILSSEISDKVVSIAKEIEKEDDEERVGAMCIGFAIGSYKAQMIIEKE